MCGCNFTEYIVMIGVECYFAIQVVRFLRCYSMIDQNHQNRTGNKHMELTVLNVHLREIQTFQVNNGAGHISTVIEEGKKYSYDLRCY